MQEPTLRGVRIRGIRDAEKILHAVYTGQLPMVRRRLDDEDRLALKPGNVYVWEERSNNPMEASSLDSIQRFTDGRSWGPSKAREDFLLYFEKESPNNRTAMLHKQQNTRYVQLVKQTFSAYVDGPANTRKWHINAYYTYDGEDSLKFVDDLPQFGNIVVPEGRYTSSRASGQRKARPGVTQRNSNDSISLAGVDTSNGGNRGGGSSSSRSSPTSQFDESPTFENTPVSAPSAYEGTLSFPPEGPMYFQYVHAGSTRVPRAEAVPRKQLAPAPPTSMSHRMAAPAQMWTGTGDARQAALRLAPLEYLQNVAPVAREPMDDRALRSFTAFS